MGWGNGNGRLRLSGAPSAARRPMECGGEAAARPRWVNFGSRCSTGGAGPFERRAEARRDLCPVAEAGNLPADQAGRKPCRSMECGGEAAALALGVLRAVPFHGVRRRSRRFGCLGLARPPGFKPKRCRWHRTPHAPPEVRHGHSPQGDDRHVQTHVWASYLALSIPVNHAWIRAWAQDHLHSIPGKFRRLRARPPGGVGGRRGRAGGRHVGARRVRRRRAALQPQEPGGKDGGHFAAALVWRHVLRVGRCEHALLLAEHPRLRPAGYGRACTTACPA
jgi:hypothetical protein